MSDGTPTELQRALADEFGRRGWEYDMAVGADIVKEVEQRGAVDPGALAARVSATWLEQNRTTRDEIARAIECGIGGRTPSRAEPATVTVTIDNRSYNLNMEPGSQISGSQVNVGGTQINVQAGTDKDEILTAVSALLRAGLGGDWNPEAAAALAQAIDTRDDIDVEDIQGLATEIALEAEAPDQGRIRRMLQSIASQGIGGALGTGITAGFGWLLQNPPI